MADEAIPKTATKDRISAVVIKDRKILFVAGVDRATGKLRDVYWTPGGKQEPTETHEQAMRRELEEELGVKLVGMKPYISYDRFDDTLKKKQTVYCYFVSFDGEIVPKMEITKFGWFSGDDIEKKRIRIVEGIEKNLIPKLLNDNLL